MEEDEECRDIRDMIAGGYEINSEPCSGSFTCGYGHDSCDGDSSKKKYGATKGQKNLAKEQQNKKRRAKRSS